METTRAHLATHGRAVAYSSDRYSVFRVNGKGKEDELTQFSRALRTLDIDAIHAHSAQAKGRVERAHQTLQDRLVKEMRLRGVDGMKAGNAYLPEFMADFNRRFAVAPRNPEDAHRAVAHDAAELDLILCEHHARKLTKNLTVRFECREYQVTGRGRGYRLRGAAVTVCKAFDGSVRVLRDGRELGRAVARRRRGGGPGGRREDGSPAGGPGQGGAAVAARLQAGAGPSLAAGVEAGRDGGRRRMRVWARFGLGLRSLRSLRPRPNRHHGRCSTRRRRRRGPVAKGDISTLDKRGHFYFALTWFPRRVDRYCANRRQHEHRTGKRFLDQGRPAERHYHQWALLACPEREDRDDPLRLQAVETTRLSTSHGRFARTARESVACALLCRLRPRAPTRKERDDDTDPHPFSAKRADRGIPTSWRRWSLTGRCPVRPAPGLGETASLRRPILGPTPAEGSTSLAARLSLDDSRGNPEHETFEDIDRASTARVPGLRCGGARR